jgi:hypothetical protein
MARAKKEKTMSNNKPSVHSSDLLDGWPEPIVQPWVGNLRHARGLCDDWGYIRDEADNLIIRVNLPTHDENVLAEHRRNKTDPTQKRVDAILSALNMPNTTRSGAERPAGANVGNSGSEGVK